MPLFKRRQSDQPDPTFNPSEVRDAIFDALNKRLGKKNTVAMRADFDKHIEFDKRNGVEAAYACLTGKLIEFCDALNDGPDAPPDVAPPSPFTVHRKDA